MSMRRDHVCAGSTGKLLLIQQFYQEISRGSEMDLSKSSEKYDNPAYTQNLNNVISVSLDVTATSKRLITTSCFTEEGIKVSE